MARAEQFIVGGDPNNATGMSAGSIDNNKSGTSAAHGDGERHAIASSSDQFDATDSDFIDSDDRARRIDGGSWR